MYCGSNRITITIAIVGWWILNPLDRPTPIRDGDEEGHVGAMELFKEYGFESLITEVCRHYGEYPPLFAGMIGRLGLISN